MPARTSAGLIRSTDDGAGYKAEIVNMLDGMRDNWFRPSDVCVAPDGSLIVADWYDPGVGGHRMGDVDKGRIFRVAPPGTRLQHAASTISSTPDGAVAALREPEPRSPLSGLDRPGTRMQEPRPSRRC